MARKKKLKKEKREREIESRESDAASVWHADLHPEVKKIISAIAFFVLAVVTALSVIGKGGTAGEVLFHGFSYLLGRGYFFAPLTFLLIGFSILFTQGNRILGTTLIGAFFFLMASLAGLDLALGPSSGGLLGTITAAPLIKFFDLWASVFIIIALFVVAFLLMVKSPFWKREKASDSDDHEAGDGPTSAHAAVEGVKSVLETINSNIQTALQKKDDVAALTGDKPEDGIAASKQEPEISVRRVAKKFDYKKPPLELLQGDRGTPSSGDIKANSNIIKRTLENFGIDVDMDEISVGPTVTQYTLKPAEGVKLAKITSLHNDMSLALAAHPLRIEAPIPGKSLVGIEVPNRAVATVGLRALLEQKFFQESSPPLLFALGRDVTGMPVFADLAKMPHLLISGATGSGKSVVIHTIVSSFLYRNPPQMLRFILVDPKRVELSVYNDIPHLLTPVITDAKTTVQALRWATKEMDRRYDLLSLHSARDIISFNSKIAKRAHSDEQDLLPYIVIIVDELADLMATFPREVESSIIRLAQMARAVGIHLIVATQRPSVEVITGLIKANITSRIALQVASQIDSRTILDMSGAEKLLGNGDMLFLAGDTAKPRRIQGAYISEHEVKRIVDFLREEAEAPDYDSHILETKLDEPVKELFDASDEDDPLYEEAKTIILEARKASASYLQRRLRVGYARAARMLDGMEQEGIVGPMDGAKPREILIDTPSEQVIDHEEN